MSSIITYSIVEVFGYLTVDGTRVSSPGIPFVISPSTGVLRVNSNLEREAVLNGYHYYELIVSGYMLNVLLWEC